MTRPLNIGFVSTRFAGTDGVSLEADKWADILRHMGHQCFWFAGELDDERQACGMLSPKAHFEHHEIRHISSDAFSHAAAPGDFRDQIGAISKGLVADLGKFVDQFNIDLLLPQNCLAIPMNIPLGTAIVDFLAQRPMPCLAHHHDFAWERERFTENHVHDILERCFPPPDQNMVHAVINKEAGRQIMSRRGLASTVIPNVMDFNNVEATHAPDEYVANIRQDLGLANDDIVFLQPTRIVPRKGIELAIDLLHRLEEPRAKLVISHLSGDEGQEYLAALQMKASQLDIDLRLLGDRVDHARGTDAQGRKVYDLQDMFAMSDFVTYPSLYEGFGNAFLEAILFRKPLLVNRYSVFVEDIEPCDFDLAVINGRMTSDAVDLVRELIASPERTKKMTDHNFAVARRHFSYEAIAPDIAQMVTDAVTAQ